jgi:hypothetical protein
MHYVIQGETLILWEKSKKCHTETKNKRMKLGLTLHSYVSGSNIIPTASRHSIKASCVSSSTPAEVRKFLTSPSDINAFSSTFSQQAQENLQKHIHEVVPEEYQKCMVGMKRNLKQTLEIRDSASDPKVKLQAAAIANDCYKFILDMTTNAGIVSDALKFVTQKKEQVDTLQKLDERIEEMEEERTTEGALRV